MLPFNSVQQAVYETLRAALAPVPVIDDAGPNQSYPYVTIGEFLGDHADTLGEQGSDLEVTVHVWSRQLGMMECADLLEQAHAALHRQPLVSPDFQWVDSICGQAQTLRDPDGKTRHGVMQVRVLTFQL
jgi:hypothetical protein